MRISARWRAASDAFCIGSEMRSLTQIRDGAQSYPAVRALRRLAEDVRSILGPSVEDRLCGRLVGVLRAPAGGRIGRRDLPPRPALGASRHRLRRHRQLHAAVGLARGLEPRRRRGRVDLRPRLSEAQRRRRRGLRLVLCRRCRARGAGSATDRRRRLRRALGVPLQGPGELVVEAARQSAGRDQGGRRDRLGAAVEADLVHRARLPGGGQGDQPAERLLRPEVVRELLPLSFQWFARRLHPVSISAGHVRALERSCEQPGVGQVCGPHGRHGPGARLGLGRSAVAGLPGSDRHLDGRRQP